MRRSCLNDILPFPLRSKVLAFGGIAGISGTAYGVNHLINKRDLTTSEIETAEQAKLEQSIPQEELENLTTQKLQKITQQTDDNNIQIAAIKNKLATESSILTTAQRAELQNQIHNLEAHNIQLLGQADKIMGGYGKEDVEEAQKVFEQENITKKNDSSWWRWISRGLIN